jgi:hypothetical protein
LAGELASTLQCSAAWSGLSGGRVLEWRINSRERSGRPSCDAEVDAGAGFATLAGRWDSRHSGNGHDLALALQLRSRVWLAPSAATAKSAIGGAD